jgi:hypothetical protein
VIVIIFIAIIPNPTFPKSLPTIQLNPGEEPFHGTANILVIEAAARG